MDDFFETTVSGTVTGVLTRLETALKQHGFGTMHVHDVKRVLESKGVEFDTALVIMDICNPGYAKQALEATDNRIAPLLPCSVALWQDGEQVRVRMVRPTVLSRFFPDSPGLDKVAAEVESKVIAAVEELAEGR
ncbi:MAG: DUF302 domain-containing protein [bacterium]